MNAPAPQPRLSDPAAIRHARTLNPGMRERDFARIHGISEAALVAAHVGHGATRLRNGPVAILGWVPSLGEVMALTRNESAVHETIGTYGEFKGTDAAAVVIGDNIDLRVFTRRWAHAFAVEKQVEAGVLRSVQFFDAEGEAVHKVHLRPGSDVAAFDSLVGRFIASDQTDTLTVPAASPALEKGAPASADELREAWGKLTDTHQFHFMLRRLNLDRLEALHMVDDDLAWPLETHGAADVLNRAVAGGVPIMAFVGNPSCIQIFGGPVSRVEPMGPWINVLDESFHLHLRLDHIDELWAVRKPTSSGHVTSIEAYAADRSLIIQFFGVREEDRDERTAWRELAEGLARRDRPSAA
jgi:putative hemin transport protein